MIYADAAAFAMPFGKHKGKKLDAIAERDDGLLYLDWLRGEIEAGKLHQVGSLTHDALIAYLDDPTIAKEVGRVVERHQ